MTNMKITLCIPGMWKDQDEVTDKVVQGGSGYLVIGDHMGKLHETGHFFAFSTRESSAAFSKEFIEGGTGSFTEEEVKQIEAHTLTVCLTGEGGTYEKVVNLMGAAQALLQAGGLGVRVETSGSTSTPTEWAQAYDSKEVVEVCKVMVSMVEEIDAYYTCGLHNFGLPDAIAFKDEVTQAEGRDLIQTFFMYNLIQRPMLQDGSIFSMTPESPKFSLHHIACKHFSEDHPFHNPYGMWALTKEAETVAITVSVPGPWKDAEEMMKLVTDQSMYGFTENQMYKRDEMRQFAFQVTDHNENVGPVFAQGGQAFTEDELATIANHTSVAYLAVESKSSDDVLALIAATKALLDAGGYGVRIETSGAISTPAQWYNMYEGNHIADVCRAFVAIVAKQDIYFTCGMHHFGLRDILTFTEDVAAEEAQELMQTFAAYTMAERPQMEDGSVFSITPETPKFSIHHADCRHFEEDHPFHNKYGMWVLAKQEATQTLH